MRPQRLVPKIVCVLVVMMNRRDRSPRRDNVGFVVVSELGSFHELSCGAQTEIARASKGRAALIPEITDHVAKRHLNFDERDLKTFIKMRLEVESVIPSGERSCSLKFFDQPLYRTTRGIMDDICDQCPKNWHWAEYVAAGGARSFHVLATMIEDIFKENDWVDLKRRYGRKVGTFADRCRSSGINLTLPIIVDESESGRHKAIRRATRMTPTARIDMMKREGEIPHEYEVPWQYKGILEDEYRIRMTLASVVGSWDSTRSAWRAFAKMFTIVDPTREHNIDARSVALFAGIFDNEGSMTKYLQHVKKAAIVMGVPWIDERDERAIKAGAKKGAIPRKRSFIQEEQATMIIADLVRQGYIELARISAVSYTYQLRVQNEGIPLETHELEPNDEEDQTNAWHSHVKITPQTTTIVLKTRKNCLVRSAIKRGCTCAETPMICGKCALDAQTKDSRSKGSKWIFPNVKKADIKIIQEIAIRRDISRPTWHGFRRGRTTDLAKKAANGAPITWEDIYKSGGWSFGSRAILQYMRREGVDQERAIGAMADLSESD